MRASRAIRTTLAVAVWVTMGITNAGFVLADVEHWPASVGSYRCKEYRSDLGFSIGWSMFPFVPVITPFATGFYEHGWTLRPRPECSLSDGSGRGKR